MHKFIRSGALLFALLGLPLLARAEAPNNSSVRTYLTQLTDHIMNDATSLSEHIHVSENSPLYVAGVNTNLQFIISVTQLPEAVKPALKANADAHYTAQYELSAQQNKALSHQLFSLEKINNKTAEQKAQYQSALNQKAQADSNYKNARDALFKSALNNTFEQAFATLVAHTLCSDGKTIITKIKTPTMSVHVESRDTNQSSVWIYQHDDIAACANGGITRDELNNKKQQQRF